MEISRYEVVRARKPAGTFSCFALVCLLVAGCDQTTTAADPSASPAETVAAAAASPTPADASTGTSGTTATPPLTQAFIRAEPNPVPAGAGPGKTTIIWDTATPAAGEIYVFDGKNEKLFGRGPKGSAEAPWIASGANFEFRLYSGTDRKDILAQVTVTRP
ncbi:MAG: hypothetical protein H0W20_02715 [Chthoniobacterales bacterium]|nr:hypothetical protein [Chthoniobacterales bacterium]